MLGQRSHSSESEALPTANAGTNAELWHEGDLCIPPYRQLTSTREWRVLSHRTDTSSHVLMASGTSALPLRQKPGLPPGVLEILSRCSSSWLKNTEVTDLLVNHRQYGLHVSLEPPVRPPGMVSAWATGPCVMHGSSPISLCCSRLALLGGMYSPSSAAGLLMRHKAHRSTVHACRPALEAPAYPLHWEVTGGGQGSSSGHLATLWTAGAGLVGALTCCGSQLLRKCPQMNWQTAHSGRASSRPGVAGGCLYLFDRRAVRFFRKDGHNWRKKADGKTVRETHEKLKARSGRAAPDPRETRGHPAPTRGMTAIMIAGAVRRIRALATL